MQIQKTSPWAPLGRPLFRALWIVTIVANVGTWMQSVGAGWMMIELGASAVMVALVQAAASVPILLLSLPAGALADIIDRRRYLISVQAWMLGVAALLAALTWAGLTTPLLLLALTFAFGVGGAMMTPAWAATVPELVPREQLQAAITLNSLGINVSRAIGPAVGGLVVTAAGPAAAFALNAVSFIGVLIVLARWKRASNASSLPAEHFTGALRAGLRYVREAPVLQNVTLRAVAFFLFAIAPWALLPLIVREAQGGAHTYGALLACIGLGAVAGALGLPRLRARWRRDALVRGASMLYAAAIVGSALVRDPYWLAAPMLIVGLAWITVLSSLHVTAQTSVPQWVRARALSVYLMAYAAGMSAGAWLWGVVATHAGLVASLGAAAAGLLLATAATWRVSLGDADGAQLDAVLWSEPVTHGEIEPDRGPVLVTVEYRIAPEDASGFVAAMQELRRVRRRDGALTWGLFEDAADPGCYVESFLVESWAEHLRQHHRATVADGDISGRARAYHRGPEPPRVSHLVAAGANGDGAR